jgi:lipopolysaccharide/colanic/teichoic acid biosynthesis glycosyltransferase
MSGGCYQGLSKRVLDFGVASILLLLLLPVIAVIAMLVLVTAGRPVLFRQRRPGLHGRPFTLLKFRTMTEARDGRGVLVADSGRLTRFGPFLRRTSLDELPELFIVVRGDMSLVGPRPLLMQYLERYTPEQARRHEIRPGITGWAQVNGRNALTWEEKFKLDVSYVDHCSLALDLTILAMTVWKVVTREGISAGGHATMPEFMGGRGP